MCVARLLVRPASSRPQLYRFRVIVGGPYILAAFPALLYAATIGGRARVHIAVIATDLTRAAVGCTLIFMLTRPGVVLWAKVSTDLLTAYFSLSVAFNIILTLAIVAKLVTARHRASKLGPYTSVSAMFIESACLYSAFGVILLIATGLKSAALQNLVLPTLSQAQVRNIVVIVATAY